MFKKLSAQETNNLIAQQVEFALIDVREQEEFSQHHQLLSCCIPYSRMEMNAERLIPCKKTPIILTDSGKNIYNRSERAAIILEKLGYTDISIMEGGMKAWEAAGLEIFEGVNTLSKSFGEFAAEDLDTPLTKPEELIAMLKAGKDIVILDTRPYGEFHNMCIPGGQNAPGAELLYRVFDLAPNPETHVIVNCAGRTRSLIGCQGLRNAKIPNSVTALKGGTMGWELAGFKLEYGQTRYTDFPSEECVKKACAHAAVVAEKAGVKYIDLATLKQWETEVQEKTLYMFDIRQPQEFEAGHYPNSISAQGGQLVQATDEYGVVRCGRYVLLDDTGARANMTAAWLNQMGYPEVYVLKDGIPQGEMVTKDNPKPVAILVEDNPISTEDLKAMLDADNCLVVDLSWSTAYKVAHIPNSIWVPRSRMAIALEKHTAPVNVVIVADSAALGQNAIADAKAVWPNANVFRYSANMADWKASGHNIEQGFDSALCTNDDVWYKPYEDTNADPADMQSYFDWEYELVSKTKRDGNSHFKVIEF